jgi:hypothetical protein
MNNQVYYNQGGGDEQYTPKYEVEVLLPYIQHLKDRIIWCPFEKPFTLLLPINILSDSIINTTMKGRDKEFQLLIPNKRIRFYNYKTGEVGNQPTFKASYFGVNIFKEQIILVDIKDKQQKHDKTNKKTKGNNR